MPNNDLARMEVRLPEQSREVRDLERLAKRVKGNVTRRGEAATYIIRLWSSVLHGEISPATFWDMFGVQMPSLSLVTVNPSPGSAATMVPIPALATSPAGGLPASLEDPEAAKQQQKRERARRNRAAASWEP
jgi:hypothetical protein